MDTAYIQTPSVAHLCKMQAICSSPPPPTPPHTLFLPWLQRSKEGSKAPGTQLSSNVVLESIFKCVEKDKLCHAGPRIYRLLCVCASLRECREQAYCIAPCRFVICCHRLSKNLGGGQD